MEFFCIYKDCNHSYLENDCYFRPFPSDDCAFRIWKRYAGISHKQIRSSMDLSLCSCHFEEGSNYPIAVLRKQPEKRKNVNIESTSLKKRSKCSDIFLNVEYLEDDLNSIDLDSVDFQNRSTTESHLRCESATKSNLSCNDEVMLEYEDEHVFAREVRAFCVSESSKEKTIVWESIVETPLAVIKEEKDPLEIDSNDCLEHSDRKPTLLELEEATLTYIKTEQCEPSADKYLIKQEIESFRNLSQVTTTPEMQWSNDKMQFAPQIRTTETFDDVNLPLSTQIKTEHTNGIENAIIRYVTDPE